jgi:hypothetical protein
MDEGWFQESPNHLTAFLQILSGRTDNGNVVGSRIGPFVDARDHIRIAMQDAARGDAPAWRWAARPTASTSAPERVPGVPAVRRRRVPGAGSGPPPAPLAGPRDVRARAPEPGPGG